MRVYVNVPVEVSLDEETQKEACFRYLFSKLNWGKDFYIENGFVKEDVEYHGSHSWSETEVRRKASPLDEAVNLIIEELRKK